MRVCKMFSHENTREREEGGGGRGGRGGGSGEVGGEGGKYAAAKRCALPAPRPCEAMRSSRAAGTRAAGPPSRGVRVDGRRAGRVPCEVVAVVNLDPRPCAGGL